MRNVYEDLTDMNVLKAEMERALSDYNRIPGVVPMRLVLFRDAIEHSEWGWLRGGPCDPAPLCHCPVATIPHCLVLTVPPSQRSSPGEHTREGLLGGSPRVMEQPSREVSLPPPFEFQGAAEGCFICLI